MNESVCIYLRKSRADREAEAHGEGETLARHERILLDLAKKKEYIVGAIYREVVSGETIADRPVMQQLLREVESGMWDGVLVVEVERLARGDTIDQGVVSRAFQYSDTKIITPTKIYDPNNEFDEEYFEFGLFMSRREYKTIKRRLNAGRISSVKEGKYCGNKPPYGYERIKLEKEKGYTLRPIPNQSEIVKMIYTWYAGDGCEQIGVAKIVRKLNDMGIKSASGNDWTPASVQGILSNPVYIGKIRWNGRKTVKTIQDGQVVKTRPRSKDTLICDGLHPAVISEELFNSVQEIRKKNPPRPISIKNSIRNPLSGIVYCSKCGRSMIRRPYQKSGQEDSLLCPYTSCPTVSSKLSLVEKAILDGIEGIVEEYKLNNDINASSEAIDFGITSKQNLIREKENELKSLNSQKAKQYDLLEQGIYTTEVFLERAKTTAASIQSCSDTIAKLREEIEHDKDIMAQQSDFIPRCEELLNNYWSLDTESKNKMLKSLIEKVVYSKDTKNAYGKGNEISFQLDIFPKIQKKS
jgi:DNA invertase Pin-like site-specific DNA recombinase